jgi:hypothetical protein
MHTLYDELSPMMIIIGVMIIALEIYRLRLEEVAQSVAAMQVHLAGIHAAAAAVVDDNESNTTIVEKLVALVKSNTTMVEKLVELAATKDCLTDEAAGDLLPPAVVDEDNNNNNNNEEEEEEEEDNDVSDYYCNSYIYIYIYIYIQLDSFDSFLQNLFHCHSLNISFHL